MTSIISNPLGTLNLKKLISYSPVLFPILNDVDNIAFVYLDEKDYEEEIFLDERISTKYSIKDVIKIKDISDVDFNNTHSNFIFHIGHCGSTLLARLLGAHPEVFCLREPGLLRVFARGDGASGLSLELLLSLYSRVWREEQTALIKATSFVSEVGCDLMDEARGRAILLGVTPPNYLKTILAGPNSREEARELAAERRSRLEQRLGRRIGVQGEGEAIALAWLCEASSLQAIADAYPDACLRLDFDRGLRDPVRWVEAALRHLGADPQAMDVEALVAGPLMQRYAKAPEHAYDADLRAAVLAQAAGAHAGEIRAGMDWLQRQAQADPRVGRVLTIAAEAARAPLAAGPAPG